MLTQEEIFESRYRLQKLAEHDRVTATAMARKERAELRPGPAPAAATPSLPADVPVPNIAAPPPTAAEVFLAGFRQGLEKGIICGGIHVCQELLDQPQTSTRELAKLSIEDLQKMAEDLENKREAVMRSKRIFRAEASWQ